MQGLWSAVTNGNWDGFLQGSVYHGSLKSFCLPGLNCYSCPGALGACPVGALQSACSGVVLRIPFYVVGTLLLAALLCGRFICGWFCPFGFVQELLYRLPGKKLRKSPRLRRLTYGKYGMAAFVAAVPLLLFGLTGIGEPAFCKYLCPAGTLEAAVPLFAVSERLRAAAGWLTAGKFLLLALLLLAAVPVYRPFCRFFSPLAPFTAFSTRRRCSVLPSRRRHVRTAALVRAVVRWMCAAPATGSVFPAAPAAAFVRPERLPLNDPFHSL